MAAALTILLRCKIVVKAEVPLYQEKLGLLRAALIQTEWHFRGAGHNDQTEDHADADGPGEVSHAGHG